MGTFTNSEDPDEMPHNMAFHWGQHWKDLQTKNTIFFKNYNLTPLDNYNGQSQVNWIKPEVRIH